jgi:hypothetical protein
VLAQICICVFIFYGYLSFLSYRYRFLSASTSGSLVPIADELKDPSINNINRTSDATSLPLIFVTHQ